MSEELHIKGMTVTVEVTGYDKGCPGSRYEPPEPASVDYDVLSIEGGEGCSLDDYLCITDADITEALLEARQSAEEDYQYEQYRDRMMEAAM